MFEKIFSAIMVSCLASVISSCATVSMPKPSPALRKGQYYFETGYYKSAMHQLMPVAIEGNAQAEYAVGYMYYYGYGVAQDPDMGMFWIQKAAAQGFPPAIAAQNMISKDHEREERLEKRMQKKEIKMEERTGVGPTT